MCHIALWSSWNLKHHLKHHAFSLTMRCFWKNIDVDVFDDVLQNAKHRANDASNDVNRPPLPADGLVSVQSQPMRSRQRAFPVQAPFSKFLYTLPLWLTEWVSRQSFQPNYWTLNKPKLTLLDWDFIGAHSSLHTSLHGNCIVVNFVLALTNSCCHACSLAAISNQAFGAVTSLQASKLCGNSAHLVHHGP